MLYFLSILVFLEQRPFQHSRPLCWQPGGRLPQPERRFRPRISLQIPTQIRPAGKLGPEWTCQTINVSMMGAYFSADVAPHVGELVHVFIEIPKEVSGKPTARYCFTARIIHVETDHPVAGKAGVGVNFYSYERMGKSNHT